MFCENKIDFDQLKRVLGEWVEPSEEERFGLNWPGRAKCINIIQEPCIATLKPDDNESVNFDKTENLFIEGDNLEVLKLLQKSYFGKVKMIYIDPPYNTGRKFVYRDKRTHSEWLNMMYPRLYLAKNLLREDGVIFISIDDHEQANLRLLCDQIFGEENFVGDSIRKTKSTTNDIKTGFNIQHENCLIYCREKDNFLIRGERKNFEKYSNPDNDPNGDWVSSDPSARTGFNFPIKNPYTGKTDRPPVGRSWHFSQPSFEKWVKEGKIKFKKSHKKNERGFICKRYKSEVQSDFNVVSSLDYIGNEYMNQAATKETQKLFNNKIIDYPKPLSFLRKLISTCTETDDIILDFFAGSCTTAHAVMQLNKEDGGNRKFIMVQLPKPCEEKSTAYQAGYKTIADIGKERIRLAAKEIEGKFDLGFKVFKLIND